MAKIESSRYEGVFRYTNSQYFTIRYSKNGKRVEESTKYTSVTDAKTLRDQRLGEIQRGTHLDRKKLDITIDDLYAQSLVEKTPAQAEKDGRRWELRMKAFFGGIRAALITNDDITRYIAACRDEWELTNGSINRDLAALQRAYTRALELGDFPYEKMPRFRLLKLKEAAPRQGFLEQSVYDEMITKVTEAWFRTVLEIAYSFGLRLNEIMSLTTKQISLAKREIYLGHTKNGEPRIAPMTSKIFELLSFQMSGKQPGDHLFVREDGTRILTFYKRWATLVESIGRPELIFHDLRRSAITNMINRGLTEDEAMIISGHKTKAVLDRYKIKNTRNIHEFALKIEAGANQERKAMLQHIEQPVRHVS